MASPDKRVPRSDTPDKGQDFSDATLSEATSSATERERSKGTALSKPQPEEKSKSEGAGRKKESVSVMDVTRKVREMFALRHGLGNIPRGNGTRLLH